MLLNIREDVEPIYTINGLGDIYVVDEMYNGMFPMLFLGYSKQLDKMFTFNCSDVRLKDFVEYVVFETTFDMINRSVAFITDTVTLMREARECMIVIIDKESSYLSRHYFCDLKKVGENYIPKSGKFIFYNKDRINRLKIKD